MIKTQYAFSLTKENTLDDFYHTLQQWGIVVVPQFANRDALVSLADEFEAFMSFEAPWAKHVPYSEGQQVRVDRDPIDTSIFPMTAEFFSMPFMESLTYMYMGNECNFNFNIYMCRDVVGSSHVANELHFDVMRAFKFFLYVTDTTEQNGAFKCIPGSHRITHYIRKRLGDQISYENRHLTRDLPMTEKEAMPIEGDAGTLIIFDSEVFHQAGTVKEGERRVMRAHCR